MERRVVKQIPLSNGNLVMDVPVPKGVRANASGLGAQGDEMTSMRYTAATCDPDDFMRNKFTLRPYLYGRQTELFVSGVISRFP
jgi:chitin synthase